MGELQAKLKSIKSYLNANNTNTKTKYNRMYALFLFVKPYSQH